MSVSGEFITDVFELKILTEFYLFQEGEHGLDEHKLHMYLSALQSLIPSLFALVLQNAPFTSKAKLQGEVPQIEGMSVSVKWNFWKHGYNSVTNQY